jgi:hypothetical protein
MLHLTVASAALKNRAKSIEKPLDLNETRSRRGVGLSMTFDLPSSMDFSAIAANLRSFAGCVQFSD